MYLEDRIRQIEERISELESAGESPHDTEELNKRLTSLEERGNWLAKKTSSIESRLDESPSHVSEDISERIDQCETTCHDLLTTDDTLRGRCDSLERRIAGLNKQMEGLLEQLAELDGRNTAPDLTATDHRLSKLESDWHEIRGLRGLRSEFMDRLAEFERQANKNRSRLDELDDAMELLKGKSGPSVDVSPLHHRLSTIETATESMRQLSHRMDTTIQEMTRRFEELGQRIDRTHRDAETRLGLLDRETLPSRLRQVEERLHAGDPANRLASVAGRLDVVEREASDVRKEVSWLRDRPLGPLFDQWARLLAGGGLAAGVCALALWLWPYKTITAERFVLIDQNRRELGELASNEHGALLELQDKGGHRRLFLAATGAGSMLTMSDEQGIERTRVAAEPVQGSGMVVFDHSGKQRVWCGVNRDPSLYMFDPNGDVRGSMSVEPTGPEIALYENGHDPCLRLVSGEAENGLRVYDAGGRLRVGVGMCADGATVNLFDPREQRRVVLSSNTDSSALAFLGQDEVQRTTLGMTDKDESIINLKDKVGRSRIQLVASEEDAKVEVLDRETNVLFSGP